MKKLRFAVAALSAGAALLASCGGLRSVSRDGYRARLVFDGKEKYEIAVAGEKRRVEGDFDGSKLVKILRPDLARKWQFRPATRKLLEEKWEPGDEIAPGYPLEPRFDQEAYAHRFGAAWKQIGDGVHGIHPCDRYVLSLPSGDRVTIYAARDLERLPVRLEHEKKTSDDFQMYRLVEILDVRIGADQDLFDKPKGYTSVRSYQELGR